MFVINSISSTPSINSTNCNNEVQPNEVPNSQKFSRLTKVKNNSEEFQVNNFPQNMTKNTHVNEILANSFRTQVIMHHDLNVKKNLPRFLVTGAVHKIAIDKDSEAVKAKGSSAEVRNKNVESELGKLCRNAIEELRRPDPILKLMYSNFDLDKYTQGFEASRDIKKK
ncbi:MULTISPECIES: hypothetical protein [Pseudomonas]|uniref:Type III secretion effector protein n=1 Tax=Pseudomonas quercus TaxID=2722792 RepID=A0ABX0Y8C7_9PSED|nr:MULTISPECIES: hypothetical protein [Pseudomonas]MBF7141030.1 hypothetical protein [Pseudomonas sp. LY10J]NJO99564.1 hypothetical protein [Pseudomonas quercus]